MTQLTITPKTADKTARFKGAVAAGEHVAVTIKGGAEWLGDDNGAHLSLRVLDLVTGRTLAIFPRPPETISEPSASADEWSTAGEDDADLFCNLNLNTDRMVNAARHMLRVPVLFVMGAKDEANPATTRTLYFRDRYEVEFWPERVGDDTPYDLDKWPKQIDEWTELVVEFGTRLTAAETDIEQAVGRADAAIAAIPQTIATAVAQSNSGKADKVANATGGNLAALDATGNLADSGKKPADFADAVQFAAHRDNTTIHIAATERSAWTAKYDKPSGGIPKADLAAAVQTSLGKADTAIQGHQSLDAYVNAAGYDSAAKEIQLKHGSTVVARIDATAFIKDGMVDSVEISGGNLVISFNTDAGIEDIEISLTDIFNPANYYDKTAADGRFVQKEAGKGLVAVDAVLSPTSANPVQNKAVAAALLPKADAADLPYALVTPGEWTFSDGIDRTVSGPIGIGIGALGGWMYEIVGGVEYSQRFSTEEDALAALSLEFTIGTSVLFTATRPSLPGHLLDRASNRVTPADASGLVLTLPAAVPGHMRDLIVRLDLTALEIVPEVSFVGPIFEVEDGVMPELEAGKVNLVSFTETAPDVIAVAHKTMQEVA